MIYQFVLYATMLCLSAATGYTVYDALESKSWSTPWPFVAAVGLEGLGFLSIWLLSAIVAHNRSLSATEKSYTLPSWRAWLPVVAYYLIVSALTVFLKIASDAYVYSLLLFPLAGLLVGWVAMEHATLKQHATSKAQARLDAKQARLEKKQHEQQPKQPLPTTQTNTKPGKIDRNLLVAQLRVTPGATNAELATPFGVSAEAVRKVRKKITPAELGLTK